MNYMLRFTKVVFNNQWNLSEEKIGSLANSNKSNAKKSQFCPNRNSTGTIYDWSVILRSFSVVSTRQSAMQMDFLKVLLLSLHLLISQHPVQKSKFGACAVTGYCSFKNNWENYRKKCFLTKEKGTLVKLWSAFEQLRHVEHLLRQ